MRVNYKENKSSITSQKQVQSDLTLEVASCPKCHATYKISASNLGHRAICQNCRQQIHLVPISQAAPTIWEEGEKERENIIQRVGTTGLDLRPGMTIMDKYEVIERLGEGGLGQVYKIRHKDWHVDLALKLPKRDTVDKISSEVLRQEAKTWVSLGLHPNIVTCYYARSIADIPAIFMEYISGDSLYKLMRPRLSEDTPPLYKGDLVEVQSRILDLIIQAAWGLDYAHSQNILHLDIKPHNLLMEEGGRLLLTDFGLSRANQSGTSTQSHLNISSVVTQSNYHHNVNEHSITNMPISGLGTPQYYSPELLAGETPAISFDLWALSLTLLELFLGYRPWEVGSVAAQAIEQYITDPKAAVSIHPSLGKFFKKALNSNQARRHQNAMDMANELMLIYQRISGLPYERPVPEGEPESPDSLNNQAISMIDLDQPEIAKKLWEQAIKDNPEHQSSIFNLSLYHYKNGSIRAEEFKQCLQNIEKNTHKTKSYDSPLMLANGYLEINDFEKAKKILKTYTGPPLNSEFRDLVDFIIEYQNNYKQKDFKPATFQSLYRLSRISDKPARRKRNYSVQDFVDQGKKFLKENDYNKAIEMAMKARALPNSSKSAEAFEFWTQLYAYTKKTFLEDIWKANETKISNLRLVTADFNSMGNLLVTSDINRNLKIIKNFWSKTSIVKNFPLISYPLYIKISPNEKLVASLSDDGFLTLYHTETGELAGRGHANTGKFGALFFSADSANIYTIGGDANIKMWDISKGYLDKGIPLIVEKIGDKNLSTMGISLDGKLASVGSPNKEHILNISYLKGYAYPTAMTALEILPDPFARFFVYIYNNQIILKNMEDNNFITSLNFGPQNKLLSAALSADSQLIAIASSNGKIYIVKIKEDLSALKIIKTLEIDSSYAIKLSFDYASSQLWAIDQKANLHTWFIDWSLEGPNNIEWDQKADKILENFINIYKNQPLTSELREKFVFYLNFASLAGIDPKVIDKKLDEYFDNAIMEISVRPFTHVRSKKSFR